MLTFPQLREQCEVLIATLGVDAATRFKTLVETYPPFQQNTMLPSRYLHIEQLPHSGREVFYFWHENITELSNEMVWMPQDGYNLVLIVDMKTGESLSRERVDALAELEASV